jgi:hypothetical protein
MTNNFCDFRRVNLGLCMKYTGGGRCDKHKSLTEIPKKDKAPRVRGDSKFQSKMGMFKGKNE